MLNFHARGFAKVVNQGPGLVSRAVVCNDQLELFIVLVFIIPTIPSQAIRVSYGC